MSAASRTRRGASGAGAGRGREFLDAAFGIARADACLVAVAYPANGDALFYDAVDGARPVETAGPALGARASVRGRRRASTGKRKRQLGPILWIDELWLRHGLQGVAQRASRSTDHIVNGFCRDRKSTRLNSSH